MAGTGYSDALNPTREPSDQTSGLALAIICHDAGGAEILSSYMRRENLHPLLAIDGPAVSIFERKLGRISVRPLEEAVQTASCVLCGTGWQSDFEWRGMGMARRLGRRCVAFLDHWMHYRERFERQGVQHLPDELWVGDNYAERIARSTFVDLPVRAIANPYFEDAARELAMLHRSTNGAQRTLLYVCEPMREIGRLQYGNELYFGYGEEEALKYFLDNLQTITPDTPRVVIRPHPAEPEGKYSWATTYSTVKIEFSEQIRTLVEDISEADVVVGLESMALVIALMGHKRVITAIPPGGRRCQLPHAGIERLTELVPKLTAKNSYRV